MKGHPRYQTLGSAITMAGSLMLPSLTRFADPECLPCRCRRRNLALAKYPNLEKIYYTRGHRHSHFDLWQFARIPFLSSISLPFFGY
jgi:hypothetical protein